MDIQFFCVYSDIGAGKKGTKEGVARLADNVKDQGKITDIKADDHHPRYDYQTAKYAEYLTPFFEQTLVPTLQKGLDDCDKLGQFPIIISGDHSNAMGNVAAFINHHANKKVAVVWIDAHADLHSVYTTPSGNLHGMPLGAVTGLDNKDAQINDPNPDVEGYWERLKGLSAPLPSDGLFFLGVRSTEPPEDKLIDQHGIFCVSAVQHRDDFQGVLDALTDKLKAFDAVYISFDIDALDETLVPATGTPVAGGYECHEVEAIFDALLSLPNIKAFEITEFNPTLDDHRQKHTIVYELFDYAISQLRQPKRS